MLFTIFGKINARHPQLRLLLFDLTERKSRTACQFPTKTWPNENTPCAFKNSTHLKAINNPVHWIYYF